MAASKLPVFGFLVYLGLVEVCLTYNIDTQHPRVLTGQENTEFGFTSMFRTSSSGLQLVVGAPKDNKGTGAIYICDVREPHSCKREYYITTPPNSARGDWYSDGELYGSMIIKSATGATIVGAPRYTSIEHKQYAFTLGRCALNGTESVVPVRGGLGDYVTNTGEWVFIKGMAQVGFSGDTLLDGSVVLGMPGFTEWKGGVVIYNSDDFRDKNRVVLNTTSKVPDFSYMGYSVVAGRFYGGRSCYATGAPGKKAGKFGSYFGASVCAADVNGDGNDDLLVGAPHFSDIKQDSSMKRVFADEGRVYVYLNIRTGDVNEKVFKNRASTVLKGSNIKNARFGTSITNIGDVNKDKYDDVAIGAPYEDGGRGVVYIYHGGPDGLQPEVKQRIMARDINETLASFGWSISRPADVDGNQHPDFAVGAYLSSKAVILRTRPIVDVQVSITTDPRLIIQDKSLCPSGVDSDSCFRLNICFRYTGVSLPTQLEFNYTVSVDTLKSQRTRRIWLVTPEGQVDSITRILIANSKGTCEEYQAISKKYLNETDLVTVVRLEAEYNLFLPANSSDIQPIANPDTIRRVVKDIAFQWSCGEDDECWSDLVLQANTRVHHGSTQVRYALMNSVVVNATKSIDLDIAVENKGETAYATNIIISWTGSITFKSSQSDYQDILCNDKTAQIGSSSGKVECNVLSPVGEDFKFDLLTSFLADNPNMDMKTVDLHISIDSQSNETDPSNNVNNITTEVWIDADIMLKGKAEPEQIVMSEEGREENTVKILHNYLVTNKGPSYLPSTNLVIMIPVYIKPEESEAVSKKQLVSDTIVTITQEEGTIGCTPETETVQKKHTTTPTPVTAPMTSREEKTTIYNRPKKPAKLVDLQQNVPQHEPNVFVMDCASYLCERYVCPLYNLEARESVIAEVNITIPAQNIPYEYFKEKGVKRLVYQTRSKVQEPGTPLFYPWTQAKELGIGTHIYPANPPKSVSLWIIIVSVIGGLLLLVIIFVILYKTGFFKREKKDQVQKLKESSGSS